MSNFPKKKSQNTENNQRALWHKWLTWYFSSNLIWSNLIFCIRWNSLQLYLSCRMFINGHLLTMDFLFTNKKLQLMSSLQLPMYIIRYNEENSITNSPKEVKWIMWIKQVSQALFSFKESTIFYVLWDDNVMCFYYFYPDWKIY